MHSATLKTPPLPQSYSCSIRLSKFTNSKPRWIQLKGKKENSRELFLKSLKCIHSSDSNIISPSFYPLKSNTRNPRYSSVSCSAVTVNVVDKLQSLVSEFKSLSEPIDRVKRLLHYATLLPPFDESARVQANRVMGCTTQVWLEARMDANGVMRFRADSDSEITKGFCSCLMWLLDGAAPEEVLEVKTVDLADMNVGLFGRAHSRVNTWHNVLISMQKRTKALVAERECKPPLPEPFPSLAVTADDITGKGSYAEAQEKFLYPDNVKVKELFNVLKDKKIGIVAHYNVDPEVQGVLTAAQKLWPHIHISDSLVMADSAVKMAQCGCQFITVLGVDFMSENVHTILDQAGFRKVAVDRMSNEHIGCSLADAAANPAYINFLQAAATSPPSLHDGSCIIHDLFGHEVVEKMQELYSQEFLTAHFEVPGEMFSLEIEAKGRGMGVVGSTQNILDFIRERVQEALDQNFDDHLQFVLGTESGMVTSIVEAVLAKIRIEIIFLVSSDSLSSTSRNLSKGLNFIGDSDLIELCYSQSIKW